MNKDDFHAAKDRLMKEVEQESRALADPYRSGDIDEFYRRITTRLDQLAGEVWQIAKDCRP